MSPTTRPSGNPTWPPWPSARELVSQRTSETAKAVRAFVMRRAARRTLRELDQLDDRLLADIGLDRAAFAELMRGITNEA